MAPSFHLVVQLSKSSDYSATCALVAPLPAMALATCFLAPFTVDTTAQPSTIAVTLFGQSPGAGKLRSCVVGESV